MTPPKVSIVIPTLNGAATLPALLDGIWRQRVPFVFEVIAIDSGSTDGTVELLRARGVEVIAIDPRTFDHGLTRNHGIEHARGELVVLTVQDAEPASDTWLNALTAPFARDARLAGTFARQQARSNAGGIARHYLSLWVAAGAEPRIAELASVAEFEALTPMERLNRCAFDNVCSCIPRSVWAQHPFPSVPIGEDIAWGRTVLLAGYRLKYVPEAVVVHSHNRSARYELSRTRALHAQLYQLFGLQTIPTLPLLARAIASSVPLHVQLRGYGPPSFARAIGWAVAWPLGQYLGARDGIRRAGTSLRAGTR